MKTRQKREEIYPKAIVYGKLVESYGGLGAPFFLFLFSKHYRGKVWRTFRHGPALEKIEMLLLGLVHTLIGVLIGVLIVGILVFVTSALVAGFRSLLSLG